MAFATQSRWLELLQQLLTNVAPLPLWHEQESIIGAVDVDEIALQDGADIEVSKCLWRFKIAN